VLADLDQRFQDAVQAFWDARDSQQQKQVDAGKIDAGTRGAVTGETQMSALEILLTDILVAAGLSPSDIRARTALELPGYYWIQANVASVAASGSVGSLGHRPVRRVPRVGSSGARRH
jgi:hypothetical protein